MGGGSKSRTKKKSKSKKKLTSSERQRIYDQIYRQVLSDIQAKKVAEEEEARRLAQEALDKKKQQARKAKEAAEKARMLNSLWATAGALLDFYSPADMTRETLYQKLAKVTNTSLDHEDDTASPIQPEFWWVNYENYTSLPTHSTWIDMKPLDASSSHPLNEVTKSTQNLSLEEKVAVREGGIGSTSAQLL
ncbi:hypothetical protein OROMI_012919 [Orobanche minor]